MKNYSPASMLETLLQNNTPEYNVDSFRDKKKQEWEAPFRASLKEALGIPPFPVGGYSLQPVEEAFEGSYRKEEFIMQRDGEILSPLFILTPEENRKNGIVLLAFHGHGPGVSAMTGDYTEEECHHFFGRQLAEAGFTVILPEVIGFGRCRLEEDTEDPKASSCSALASQLLPLGYTLTGLRLMQAAAVLELTEERFGTDRLGSFGFSGGGLIAYLLAALDKRIKALGLAGYGSTFEKSLYEHTHCLDNYIPGLFRLCDQPEIANLIAPRPLYVEAGNKDTTFPIKGGLLSMERIRRHYARQQAEEYFTTCVLEGKHEIQGADMIRWYKETL